MIEYGRGDDSMGHRQEGVGNIIGARYILVWDLLVLF